MKARVAVLAGDGIGPEVIAEGLRCLHAIAELFGHEFELTPLPFGGAAIDSHADPLPERTLSACLAADAVLLGAVGGPQWAAPQAALRPEAGLLRLGAGRSHGAAGSPRSTRRTYWRLHGCGARCARGSWRANSPISPWTTCWWTRRPCT